MIKYFFILGRNPELSRAELYSYLQARGMQFNEIFTEDNFLVVELDKDILFDIQDFGGIIKLGKITAEGSTDKIEKYLEKEEVIPADKFTYSILGNGEEGILIQKFKNERKKAVIRHGRKALKMESGDLLFLPNAEFEIFFHSPKNSDKYYFGLTQQDYSYEEVKARDMKKPVRREELAISPRLAKILINLSQIREGELLVDPFCGVGGILQEAILRKIDGYGVDMDKKAIESAKKNILWIEKNFNVKGHYKLIASDSKFMENVQADGIATEPSLAENMKWKMPEEKIKEFMFNFEKFMIAILIRMRQIKKSKAKIAITLPIISNLSPNIETICEKTGLRIHKLPNVAFPIKESRKDQFVSREFIVFE
jgi:tRNA G10  N-methylase Trm11